MELSQNSNGKGIDCYIDRVNITIDANSFNSYGIDQYSLTGLKHVINGAGDWSRVCREHLQYCFDEKLYTIGH